MKLKTRIILGFTMIILMPLLLFAAPLYGFSQSQAQKAQAVTESDGTVYDISITDSADSQGRVHVMAKDLFISAFVILISVALVVGLWVYRSIAVPLVKLKKATQNIKEGNLDFVLDVEGKDEFSELCQDFEEMRRRLKESTEEKSLIEKENRELISNISHDLKTPITTVAGYVQALNDGMVEDPEKQKQYLESIRKKSLEMSELITLLFNYVKLDSEGFDLKKERINITELVLQLVAGAYTDMEEAGMIPDIDIPEEADYAEIDKMQFSRAFTNLLTNAIKHNEAGTSIKISMKKQLSYLVIKVMDSGERIDPELAQQLFDPFVMGDESRNSRGGSGLGLSVSKKVIEMHGGSLTLEQPTEEGYTKAFCIKIKQVEEKPYEYE